MKRLLRRPPTFALAAGLAMLTIGAVTGGVLVTLQDSLYALARREIVRRPEIHGFAGTEVIDAGRIVEIADQSNTALRLLHSHAVGMGILILLATIVIANLGIPRRVQIVLCGMLSVGAFYPLGWLFLAWLIPYWGVERLRGPVEWTVFVPFGSLIVAGLCAALAWPVVVALLRILPNKSRP